MKYLANFRVRLMSFPEKPLVNTAIGIVLISFLFMALGCGYYRIATKANTDPPNFIHKLTKELFPEDRYPRSHYPESNLEMMLWMNYDFYVIDSLGQWALKDMVSKGDTLFAKAVNKRLPKEDNPDDKYYLNGKKFDPSVEKDIVNRIKFYVDTLHFWKGDTAAIPFADIHKYDVYKNDSRRDAGVALAVVGGVVLFSLIIAAWVAIANWEPEPTSSCPYVFTYQEDSCLFNGEIFSGAIFRSLERDDYLALHSDHLTPGSDYDVKMANMLEEVQYINQAELLLVSHDTSVNVYLDKYGDVQTVREAVRPSSAFDSRGKDVLELVAEADRESYDFDERPDTAISCMNHIDLVFTCPSRPDSCKILVKGHNTLWIDLLTRGLQERLGRNYAGWVKLMDRRSSERQKEWVLSQGLPLQVFVLKNGDWQLADYFDIVGPIAAREMVMALDVRDAWTDDLSGPVPENRLSVRLVTGYYFWELDYATMDFTENVPVEKRILQPEWITDQDGEHVERLLASDDRRYLVQDETGDEALMHYTIPGDFNGSGSIFLHSKGYYHAKVPADGKSELAFIWAFLKPGKLSAYSYQNYLSFQELLTRK